MAKYQCPGCGYTYDEIQGNPHEGFPPGTLWSQVPEDYACPDCAVRDKEDFILIGGTPPDEAAQTAPSPAAAAPVTPAAPAAHQAPQPASVAQAPPAADTVYRKWLCITCGHIYDEALGDEHEGFAPGTLFSQIPNDWCCPDCGATKEDYVLYEEKLGELA